MHVAGRNHPHRRATSCRNGHRYTKENTREARFKKWNKATQTFIWYISRECRRCKNVRKKFEARRLRALGRTKGGFENGQRPKSEGKAAE